MCPSCGGNFPLTTDHIVPIWLRQQVGHFGITHGDICAVNGFDINLERKVCKVCNYAKGGNINYKDPIVRKYISTFIYMVVERLRGVSSGKLKVRCACNDTVATLSSTVMQAVVNTHNGVIPLSHVVSGM